MDCTLTQEQHLSLVKKLTNDLNNHIAKAQPLDLESYIKDLYKKILAVSDINKTLMFIALVPKYIRAIGGSDLKIGKLIAKQAEILITLQESFDLGQNIIDYVVEKPFDSTAFALASKNIPNSSIKPPINSFRIQSALELGNSAIPTTMLAPTGQMSEKNAQGKFTNIVKQDQIRTNDVLIALIKKLIIEKKDSGNALTYSGHTGFMLRLINESQLPANVTNLRTESGKIRGPISHFMVQVITDNNGNILSFDKNANLTSADKGEAIHFAFRGSTKKTIDNHNIMIEDTLIKYEKLLIKDNLSEKSIKQSIDLERETLNKTRDRELVIIRSLEQNYKNNPNGLHLQEITGGTTGYLPEALYKPGESINAFPRTKDVNIDDNDLLSISFNLTDGKTTLKLKAINKEVMIQAYGFESDFFKDRVELISKVITSSKISDRDKIQYLDNFLKLKTSKLDTKSKVYFNIYKGELELEINGEKIDLTDAEAVKKALVARYPNSSNKLVGLYFSIKTTRIGKTYTEYEAIGDTVKPINNQQPWLNLLKEFTKVNLLVNANNDIVQLNGHFVYAYNPEYTSENKKEDIKKSKKLNDKSIDSSNPIGFDMSKLIEDNTTKEDSKRANTWFENSDISKIKVDGKVLIPLQRLQHITNSTAFANWSLDGIKLYNGSNDTLLYHESWHGFSQLFLTHAEKDNLYKETAKLKGSFKVVVKSIGEGGEITPILESVKFSEATKQQLEEYLAEGFRAYAVKEGKIAHENKTISNIFKRIYEFIKAFFKGVTIKDTYSNITEIKPVMDMYKALYNNKIQSFIPSVKNVLFSTANAGMLSISDINVNPKNHTETKLISDSIDALISYHLNSSVDKLTLIPTGEFTIRGITTVSNKKKLYNAVKNSFIKRYTELLDIKNEANIELSEEEKLYLEEHDFLLTGDIIPVVTETDNDKNILQHKIDLLNWSIINFGDINETVENYSPDKVGVGVIGYHMANSIFKDILKVSSVDEVDPNSNDAADLVKGDGGYGDHGNNAKNPFENVNEQVKYLLSSLLKQDTEKKYITNELGFPTLIPYKNVKNSLERNVFEIPTIPRLYKKIQTLAVNSNLYTQLLYKLGDPLINTQEQEDLWLRFINITSRPIQEQIVHIIEKKISGNIQEGIVETIIVKTGSTDPAPNKVRNAWLSQFKMSLPNTNPYIETTKDNTNILNLEAIKKDFLKENRVSKGQYTIIDYTLKPTLFNNVHFLRALGLRITATMDISDQLIEFDTTIGLLANAVGNLVNRNNKEGLKLEIDNPISFFSKSFNTVEKIIDSKGVVKERDRKISGQNAFINKLARIEMSNSDDYSSSSVLTPEGERKSKISTGSTVSKHIYPLQLANDITELYDEDGEFKHMSYLHPANNPYAKSSIILNSMFYPDGKTRRNNISTVNLGGLTIRNDIQGQIEEVGKTHASMNIQDKFVADFGMLLTTGILQHPTTGGKSTHYATKLDFYDTYQGKQQEHLYIDTHEFISNDKGEYEGLNYLVDILIPKIQSELERILMYKKDKVVYNTYRGFSEKTHGTFAIFKGLLSPKTQKELINNKIINDTLKKGLYPIDGTTEEIKIYNLNRDFKLDNLLKDNEDLYKIREEIKKEVKYYFDKVFKENNEQLVDKYGYIAESIREEIIKYVPGYDLKNDKHVEILNKAAIRSFSVNTWINNVEIMYFHNGGLEIFDHTKEEGPKRFSPFQSGGSQFATDEVAQKIVNQHGNLLTQKTPGASFIPFKGTLNTGIIKDYTVTREDVYEYLEKFFRATAIREGLTGDALTEELYGAKKDKDGKIIKLGTYKTPLKGGVMTPYKNPTVSDGQGLIGLDAYRMLWKLEGPWSDEQEDLYLKIVNGETINASDVFKYFPVYKLQYAGNLKTKLGLLPVTAIHKFALMPLIPGIGFESWDQLHNQMMIQNVHYVTHNSGSKLGSITSNQNAESDDIFDEDGNYKQITDIITGTSTPVQITKNVIYVDYLKNQTKINTEYKGSATYAKQLNILLSTGLIENGVPIDFEPKNIDRLQKWKTLPESEKMKSKYYNLVHRYTNIMNHIVELRKEELVNSIAGWKYDKVTKGAIGPADGSMITLITYVKTELIKQGLTKHEISSIDFDGLGQLSNDLSGSPIADTIEKALMSHLDAKIRRQYLTGEPLIEVSAAYTNLKLKKATKEEIAKYGNKSLKYYGPDADGNKSTTPSQVKIALQGSFLNLLYLNDLDNNPIAVYDTVEFTNKEGKIETKQVLNTNESRLRLNELLGNEDWLNINNNRKKITLVGVRIPIQGLNSMEYAEVAEFLPTEAGNIIILSEEIVAKSGTDFDVDKLTTYYPTILKDGSWLEHGYDNKEDLDIDIDIVHAELEDILKKKLGSDGTLKELQQEYKTGKKDKNLVITALNVKKDIIRTIMFNDILDLQEFIRLKNAINPVSGGLLKLIETTDKYNAKLIIDTFKSKPTIISKGPLSEAYDRIKQSIDELKEIKDLLTTEFNEKSNYLDHEPELKKLNDDYQKLKEFKRNFIKSFENQLIDSIKNILELPVNAKRLLTPNSTIRVEHFADELQPYVDDFNFKKSKALNGEDVEKGTSPTTVLEYAYLLKKHDDIFVSKESLGIGADSNKSNIIYNSASAHVTSIVYFPIKEFVKRADDVEISEWVMKPTTAKIYLPINKMITIENGEKVSVISLSHLKDKFNKNEISEIISQLMNGWLDSEKSAWITYIQGNKEVTPQILFLLQAGVPIRDILYFVTNPIIREYVLKIKLGQGLIYKLNNPKQSADMAKSNARKEIYKNVLRKGTLPNMVKIVERLDADYGDTIFSTNLLEGIAKSKLEDVINSPDAISGFLHYLYIEELTKIYNKPITNTNLDKTKSDTLYDAFRQEIQIEELYNDINIPKEIPIHIIEDGPTSEYAFAKLANDLFGKLFSSRNDKRINVFVRKILTTYSLKTKLQTETGIHPDVFSLKFKNAIANYLFINELKSVKEDTHYKGLPVTYNDKHKTSIEVTDKGMIINKKLLKKEFDNRDYVLEQDGPTSYRSRKLSTLDTKVFFPNDSPINLEKGYNEYIQFVMAREYLRSHTTFDDFSTTHEFEHDYKRKTKGDHAPYRIKSNEDEEQFKNRVSQGIYEEFLRNRALEQSFNLNTMFYNNRQHGIVSYANTLINLVNKYPGLKELGVLQQLAASPYYKEGDNNPLLKSLVNLTLRDAGELTPESIEQYADDLKKLADPNKKKIEGSSKEIIEDNARLSELFANFPTYIELQGGMNKHQFAFPNIFPADSRMSIIMNNAVKKADKHLTDSNLDIIFEMFLKVNKVSNKLLAQRQSTQGYLFDMFEYEVDSIIEPTDQPTDRPISIIISTTNYTKETPNDKSKGFFFTENLQAFLALRNRSNEVNTPSTTVRLDVTAVNNQAGIRIDSKGKRNTNSFAIISKKYQQNTAGVFVKEEGQFKDTNEDFELFKQYNIEAIQEALTSKLPLTIAEGGIATGKSALPLRFAEWLNNELNNKLGVKGTIKKNNVIGYDGYGIFNLTKPAPKIETGLINLTIEQKKIAKDNAIEQNFYNKKPYAKTKDLAGNVIAWDVYKTKDGSQSSMEGALKGSRTQSTRSVPQQEQLLKIAKSQGITSGVKGTIVYMEDKGINKKGEKSPTFGLSGWFKITSDFYTPNKKEFNKYENWAENVWEGRNSEFKIGQDNEWKSIRFEVISQVDSTPLGIIPIEKIIKNEGGLIIIENAIDLQTSVDIVTEAASLIEDTSFKQTGGSVSWGWGHQWIRVATLTKKQMTGVALGKQLGGFNVTQQYVDDLISGKIDSKKSYNYVYTRFDKNGKELPNIPTKIINLLAEKGIDISEYEAGYNSVYDKNDKGSLIIHQDNTETNKSPIITLSFGRAMKFITYQLKDGGNFNFGTQQKNKYELTLNDIASKLVANKLAPELKRGFIKDKNNKEIEYIIYGQLTPSNLAKYAKLVGRESEALTILAETIEKREEFVLANGALLIFSKENRNVFHEIVFDEETDKQSMPKGFPTLTINKAYTGLGQADKMVKTDDYRVVLTLRKVIGTETLDNVKLISPKKLEKLIGFDISKIAPNIKDPKKAKIATDIIEFGRDTVKRKSSSVKYGKAAVEQGIPRNSGNYNSNTVAMTTTSGNNVATKEDINNTVIEILKVLNSGGSIIMDNKVNRNSSWNISGEGEVWKQFTSKLDINNLENISKDADYVQIKLKSIIELEGGLGSNSLIPCV